MQRTKISILLLITLFAASCAPVHLTTDQQIATGVAGTSIAKTSIAQMVASTQTAVAFYVAQTMAAMPTNTFPPQPPTDLPSATPEPFATVNGYDISLRSGPGQVYTYLAAVPRSTRLMVIGKDSGCTWFKVILPGGQQGWIKTEFLTYSFTCDQVAFVPPPPTPTPLPYVPPTATPCSGSTVSILIINNTGGAVTVYLSGACSYVFSIGVGNQYINLVPGSYSYTATGCGGATLSGSKTLQSGDEWTWYCQ